MFQDLNVDQMVEVFTNKLYSIMKVNVPSRVPSINDKDPPWITRQVKAAVKRKLRVFRKYTHSGRKQEHWENFNIIRNETSRMDAKAKEQ